MQSTSCKMSCWINHKLQAQVATMADTCTQEELPHVRGQGQRPRVAGCDGAGMVERSHPASEVRVGDGMSHSVPEARGSGREDNPRPRTGGCAGTGGARGAIPY